MLKTKIEEQMVLLEVVPQYQMEAEQKRRKKAERELAELRQTKGK